ncbi:unnamed protein product [Closterium sp. NIES-54]
MAQYKTQFQALRVQPLSLPAATPTPSAAASPCDVPLPPNAVSAVKCAAEPVLIVDKWRAVIRCCSQGTSDALGCSGEKLADGASIYELAEGMEAADWTNAVGSLSLGALWSAIEFWLRRPQCSGPLSRHRVRFTLQRLRATSSERFLLATLSPAVGVCSSVEVFAGDTEAAADGHLAPPHLRHLLASAQLSAPPTPTGRAEATKGAPSKDSTRSPRPPQATRNNYAVRTSASRGEILDPPQSPSASKSGEISCVSPNSVAGKAFVTVSCTRSYECDYTEKQTSPSKGNRLMRSLSSLLSSLNPKSKVRSPPEPPQDFAEQLGPALPGNQPASSPGPSPNAAKSSRSPRTPKSVPPKSPTAACGRHAPDPAPLSATSRGRSAAACSPAPTTYGPIPKSYTSPAIVFKNKAGLSKSPSAIGAAGSGGLRSKSSSGNGRTNGNRVCNDRSPVRVGVSVSAGRHNTTLAPAAAAAVARVDAGSGGGSGGGGGSRPSSSCSQGGRTAGVIKSPRNNGKTRASTPPQLGASKSFGGVGNTGGMVSPVAQTAACGRRGSLSSPRPSVANGGVVCLLWLCRQLAELAERRGMARRGGGFSAHLLPQVMQKQIFK